MSVGNRKNDPGLPAETLADDLLQGASAIAKYIFGCDTKETRRKVFFLAEKGRLPTFKLGSGQALFARRSQLRAALSAKPDTENLK